MTITAQGSASTTSTSGDITAPSDIQAGDLIVLLEYGRADDRHRCERVKDAVYV
jgi:hypothetical protein